jgi:UMP-CMP kinase
MEGWNKEIGDKVNVHFCLFLEATEEQMKSRVLKRGETSGRNDDNESVMMKRLNTFQTETMEVIEGMEIGGKVRKIDASKSIDDVFNTITRCLKDEKLCN